MWLLMGGMEMHVVTKHLLAATVLTTNFAPKLVPMNIVQMSVFVLCEEALAALFAVVMAVQDCPASSPGVPFQALALVSTLRCIQGGVCVRLTPHI